MRRYSTQIRSSCSMDVKSSKSPAISMQKSLITLFRVYQWQKQLEFSGSCIVWVYTRNSLEPWYKLISIACLVSICRWYGHLASWGCFAVSVIWTFFPFDFFKLGIFTGWAFRNRCSPSFSVQLLCGRQHAVLPSGISYHMSSFGAPSQV